MLVVDDDVAARVAVSPELLSKLPPCFVATVVIVRWSRRTSLTLLHLRHPTFCVSRWLSFLCWRRVWLTPLW
jgi:hypothetical protein